VPDIVYVDNEPGALVGQAAPEQQDRIAAYDFNEAAEIEQAFEAARDASLWLFDFFLVEDHGSPEEFENGLSLFNKWRGALPTGHPATMVVSNHLEKALGAPPGPLARHHVHAQRLGVEWIGDKSSDSLARVVQLADASRAIADGLAKGEAGAEPRPIDVERICFDVLSLSAEADWVRSAQRQVDRSRPPRIGPPLKGFGAARPLVSWLLSHVLPYPSFLLSDAQAAVRLGIQPVSFAALASAKPALFDPLRYQGPLAGFHGPRWWRAAIDDFGWQLTQSAEDYRSALAAKVDGVAIDWLAENEPVLVSDHDLVETAEVADASECVRAADEDFPANVEPAWIRIGAAKEDRHLAAKVIFEDLDLIDAQ
jgi:hypothetical protein